MGRRHHDAHEQDGNGGYLAALRVPEFRALYVAQVLSLCGDWLTRIAVAVLVYDQTGSPVASSLAFVLAALPWAVAAPLLSGLADRRPRRQLMITCDLLRAATMGVALLPFTRWQVLLVLVLVSEVAAAPFAAARSAMVPSILPKRSYTVGLSLQNITGQLSQVLGFAVGGLLVALLGAHPALAVDCGTFLVSAMVLRLGVRARPAASGAEAGRSVLADLREGAALVFGDRVLRSLVIMAWLAPLISVTEGVAAPLADRLGGGPTTVGLLLAAHPAGVVVAGVLVGRLQGRLRTRVLMPMATVGCLALSLLVLEPPLLVTLVLLVVAGIGTSYMILANVLFVERLPDGRRGQAFGLVSAGLYSLSGLYLLGVGALASAIGPARAAGTSGILGLVVLAAVVLARQSPAAAVRRLEPSPPAAPSPSLLELPELLDLPERVPVRLLVPEQPSARARLLDDLSEPVGVPAPAGVPDGFGVPEPAGAPEPAELLGSQLSGQEA